MVQEIHDYEIVRFFRYKDQAKQSPFVAVCPTPTFDGRFNAIRQHESNGFRDWSKDRLAADCWPSLEPVRLRDVPDPFLDSVRRTLWRADRDRCGLCSLKSRQAIESERKQAGDTLDVLAGIIKEVYLSVYFNGTVEERAEAVLALMPIAKRIEARK